ncbi:MAG: hypothetical protein EOO74_00360 [Myxococcales bacterium]|nr:MAG: hypothetical protein EOO74_00360 [Myxococcales bacterium]
MAEQGVNSAIGEDGELREASDPMTPGGRLAELFQAAPIWDASEEDFSSRRMLLCHALLNNPSLPPALIEQAVGAMPRPTTYAVWHNPTLPLLLLNRPDPWLRDMARMALMFAQAFVSQAERTRDIESLESMVEHWRTLGPGLDAHQVRALVWRLAGRLAFLFGLPWSAPSEGQTQEGSAHGHGRPLGLP